MDKQVASSTAKIVTTLLTQNGITEFTETVTLTEGMTVEALTEKVQNMQEYVENAFRDGANFSLTVADDNIGVISVNGRNLVGISIKVA